MKQFTLILMIFILTSAMPCYALIHGTMIQEIISATTVERFPLRFASDQQMYTNGIGGISFSYPAGWFAQAPNVQVSIIQNVAHPATETYVAEVCSNSTTSTEVMVYLVNGGIINEAPTGSITVTLWAVDIPL